MTNIGRSGLQSCLFGKGTETRCRVALSTVYAMPAVKQGSSALQKQRWWCVEEVSISVWVRDTRGQMAACGSAGRQLRCLPARCHTTT